MSRHTPTVKEALNLSLYVSKIWVKPPSYPFKVFKIYIMPRKKWGRIKFHSLCIPEGEVILENEKLGLTPIEEHESKGTAILAQNASKKCKGFMNK